MEVEACKNCGKQFKLCSVNTGNRMWVGLVTREVEQLTLWGSRGFEGVIEGDGRY